MSEEFDFKKVFDEPVETPSVYDERFGDPITMSKEKRVEMASETFSAYEFFMTSDPSEEEREKFEISFDTFMRWIDLNDEEREEAQEIVASRKKKEE